MLREELSNLKRSWIHHTGMQITTLLVLVASFSIVSFVLIFMINIDSIIANWGDSIRVTAYMKDELTPVQIETLKQRISNLKDVAQIEFVDKAKAKDQFKLQMATYAPSLANDAEFSNPFPASFIVSLKASTKDQVAISRIQKTAAEIQQMAGVEDVSYGQNWVKNFSQLADGISKSGWMLILVLLAGSLLIISNSIRVSISTRKDEIEILELVGATSSMIRSPFIFEAAVMGFIAMTIAIVANYGFYLWGSDFIRENVSFARLSEQIAFMRPLFLVGLFICGPAWGALSAYFTVRKLNSGWAATEGKFE